MEPIGSILPTAKVRVHAGHRHRIQAQRSCQSHVRRGCPAHTWVAGPRVTLEGFKISLIENWYFLYFQYFGAGRYKSYISQKDRKFELHLLEFQFTSACKAQIE